MIHGCNYSLFLVLIDPKCLFSASKVILQSNSVFSEENESQFKGSTADREYLDVQHFNVTLKTSLIWFISRPPAVHLSWNWSAGAVSLSAIKHIYTSALIIDDDYWCLCQTPVSTADHIYCSYGTNEAFWSTESIWSSCVENASVSKHLMVRMAPSAGQLWHCFYM